MKITREQLKNIVRETLLEESEYQKFFKKALEKAGKSIPSMSDEEKKSFFNKIEKTWKGRGSKNERFGRGAVGPTFGSQELDEVNPNSSEIGKGDNKKPSKDASDSSNIKEAKFKAKGYKPKDAFGARIIKAIDNNIVASDVQDLKREGDDNAKILEKGKAFLDMAQNGIKSAFKFKYQIHPDVDFPMRQTRGSNYFWFKSREDMEKYLKKFLSDLKKLEKMIDIFMKKPTLKAQQAIVNTWRREIMVSSNKTGGMAYGIMKSADNGQSIYKEGINQSVNEAKLNVRDLPEYIFDDPDDFEDWYNGGMELDKKGHKLATFSKSDERKLFRFVEDWIESRDDNRYGHGSSSDIDRDIKDIEKFLKQKGKVIKESRNND